MSKKLSQLTSTAFAQSGDLFYLVRGDDSFRIDYNDLVASIVGVSFQFITLSSGAIDGVNNIFTWANQPLQVFYNGQLLEEGVGYTRVGNITTLTLIPFTGESLTAYGNY